MEEIQDLLDAGPIERAGDGYQLTAMSEELFLLLKPFRDWSLRRAKSVTTGNPQRLVIVRTAYRHHQRLSPSISIIARVIVSDPVHPESSFSLRCNRTIHAPGPFLWFMLKGDSLYLAASGERLVVPNHPDPPVPAAAIAYSRCIGSFGGQPCMAIELGAEPDNHELTPVTLRESHAHLGEDLWVMAGRAGQILRWRRDHRFCGRCGGTMEEVEEEALCRCPQCGFFTYPRISPAVIMSVVRDGKILLGRAPRFPGGIYSVLAGFVEPGETLEQAVAREVREEVNIEIRDIRYVASQPWPFPHSLMLGFTARHAGGEIEVDNQELEDAGWFSPTEMPRLPSRISIARRLIEMFLTEHGR